MLAYLIASIGIWGLILAHLTMGDKEVVRPLLASRELEQGVVCILLLCWHLVTLVLILASAAYMAAAVSGAARPFALAGTILLGSLAILSLAVVILKRQRHRGMPQWIAFGAVATLGLWGHFSS